jgi:hypothetical protein
MEARAANINQDPLRNTTWKYCEAAKQVRARTCGERCANDRLRTGYSKTVSTSRRPTIEGAHLVSSS